MIFYRRFLATTAMAACLGATASGALVFADDHGAMPGAIDPYEKPDQASIVLSGNVVSQVGDSFMLDFGDGLITVEMDDWDWHNEAARINPGETVTVRGEIDKDLYETKTIEASSVYVVDRATYYYASDTDEEDSAYWNYGFYDPKDAPEGTWFGLTGTVEKVKGTEFKLDTGLHQIMVETAHLAYNPLDDTGFQQVDVGDRVYVSGPLDKAFFDEAEVEATSVITLSQDKTKTTGK
ncbi:MULTISPECIES: NirD/YgiW/YdeI family stress tolerance protein [Kordiimonas]|jgi:uncharacterized protein YdeI (BOF family)|uniref:NirD/YgiW/YdeI family stress tolerance protein n=1 Tax=Kordiimonas TaxID=288021 RepID=UPI00257D20BB|nr:NirD/YgiW/YdeI family stress tolerance protein [Kordiimonas sp. UBA4487]